MANFEIQIQTSAFLAAQLAGVQSAQVCPPPPFTVGTVSLRLQQIEFGQNTIRHDKGTEFSVWYESRGQSFGLIAEGFQTQIAQQVILHVTTDEDVLTHPNQPPASMWQVPLVVVMDLDYFVNGGQCYFRSQYNSTEWPTLPPLPPLPGVDQDQVKQAVEQIIANAVPAPTWPLDIAHLLTNALTADPHHPAQISVENAGLSVTEDLSLVVFRAEVGPGTDVGDVTWGNFFRGFITDRVQGATWGWFLEKGMLELTLSTYVWYVAQQNPDPSLHLISVGSQYSNPGGAAHIDTTVHATVDAGLAGTHYVQPVIRIGLSVSQPDHLTADVRLPSVRALANYMLITVRLVLQDLLGPLNGFAQAALDSLVVDGLKQFTGLPGCTQVEPLHQRCDYALAGQSVAGTQLRVTGMAALADGVTLTGELVVPQFTGSELTVSVKEFGWTPPDLSCSSADIAAAAAFRANIQEAATVTAQVLLDHAGSTPAYLCGISVLNDPLGKFPPSGLQWDGTKLPVRVTLTVPNPGPQYAADPYPVDLLVSTTLGTRLVRLAPAPDLTQADMARLEGLVIGQIANCELLAAPVGLKLRWLVDPPFEAIYQHQWLIAAEGVQPGDTVSLIDAAGKVLVSGQGQAGLPAVRLSAVVAAEAGELSLARQLAQPAAVAGRLSIQQQLLTPLGTVPLDAGVRRVLASAVWSGQGVAAVLDDGVAAFDLSNPQQPRATGRWYVSQLRGAFNWAGGLLTWSKSGFVNIDGAGRLTAAGPASEPAPILDAALGDTGVYVLTSAAVEFRGLDLAAGPGLPSNGARSLLRLGSRLLAGGAHGITVYRISAPGQLSAGVSSAADLSVTSLEVPAATDDGAVLATLADGSARLLAVRDDDQMTVAAAYPQPPWFAGGTRLGGTLVLPGAGGRSLELRAAAGQPRALGSDATDAIAPGLAFTDWTSISDGQAVGQLHGHQVTLTGPLGTGSVTNASFPLYASDAFSPPLAASDTVNIVGQPGHIFTLTFGAPMQDVVLHLASCGSVMVFPAETAMAKVSGDSTLTVSGSTVTGGVRNPPPGASSPTDSNGTIRLYGVLSSVTFSATTNFIDPTRPDGIYLQVGALVPAADTGPPG